MTQNRYGLSDSDLLGIYEAIDNSVPHDLLVRTVKAVWNAILAQEGLSWDDVDALIPGDYAIPADQLTEIAERFKKRAFALGFSKIGVTNLMLDLIVQYGPVTYNDEPKQNTTDHILPPPTK